MRYVENRRPTGWAGVEYRKYSLKVAIQVNRWNCPATKHQHIVPGIPPVMNDPGGKNYGFSGLYNGFLISDSDSESSFFHDDFFTRVEMHV